MIKNVIYGHVVLYYIFYYVMIHHFKVLILKKYYIIYKIKLLNLGISIYLSLDINHGNNIVYKLKNYYKKC